jgi:hypothetical protein
MHRLSHFEGDFGFAGSAQAEIRPAAMPTFDEVNQISAVFTDPRIATSQSPLCSRWRNAKEI